MWFRCEYALVPGLISFSKATRHGVEALSRKLLKLLEDKEGQLYQDNVAKFGIPEEYVRAR